MTNTDIQGLRDKQFRYFGSQRMYYSGLTVGSTTAWNTYVFSGTNNGFGISSDVLSQRFAVVSSGASSVEFSFNAGTTVAGEVFPGQAITLDGVNKSGVDLRAVAAGQLVQVWAW